MNGFLAPPVGLEPTTFRLTAERSTDWANEEYWEISGLPKQSRASFWNPAATYSPGPSPAKYHQRERA